MSCTDDPMYTITAKTFQADCRSVKQHSNRFVFAIAVVDMVVFIVCALAELALRLQFGICCLIARTLLLWCGRFHVFGDVDH